MFFGVIPGVGAIACVAFAIAAAVCTFLDRVVKLTRFGRSDLENQFYLDKDNNNVVRIKGNDKYLDFSTIIKLR